VSETLPEVLFKAALMRNIPYREKSHNKSHEKSLEKSCEISHVGETGAFLAIFVKVNFRSNYVRI
jgi:hypothetical protein